MNLIQFVNNNEEAVEQGDVLIIGDKQAQLYRSPYGEIYPEVDLTNAAYDTRACGIVAELHAEVEIGEIKRDDEESGETSEAEAGGAGEASDDASGADKDKKARRAKKADKSKEEDAKADDADASSAQTFTPEEYESLDRTRIGPGQRGYMVVLGTYGHCKVDADIAPIKIGDLLTTSPTKGHAQKALDPAKATGAVIGKALGALKKGKGKIPILVTLQ